MLLSNIQVKIIMLLTKEKELSRKEICYFLAKPRTTIYDNLFKLQKLKLTEKFKVNNNKVGRPIIKWKLKGVLNNK